VHKHEKEQTNIDTIQQRSCLYRIIIIINSHRVTVALADTIADVALDVGTAVGAAAAAFYVAVPVVVVETFCYILLVLNVKCSVYMRIVGVLE